MVGPRVPRLDFLRLQFRGRQEELEILHDAHKRVLANNEGSASNTNEVVLVEGNSGSGKSALVNQFVDKVKSQKKTKDHIILKGKFDNDSTSQPYSAIIECLECLIPYLAQDMFRESIRRKCYSELKALAALAPSITADYVDDISEEDSASFSSFGGSDFVGKNRYSFNRLCLSLRVLLREITNLMPSGVIIMIMDDLQCADQASLAMLASVANDAKGHGMMLLGTHRFAEDAGAASSNSLQKWTESLVKPATVISLQGLTLETIQTLLVDLTRREPRDVEQLAHVVLKKTAGNPFFVVQFVQLLASKKLITFDVNRYRWCWDIEQVAANAQITDNIVQIVTDKMNQYPFEVRHCLMYAAFLGSAKFSVQHLKLTPAVRLVGATDVTTQETKDTDLGFSKLALPMIIEEDESEDNEDEKEDFDERETREESAFVDDNKEFHDAREWQVERSSKPMNLGYEDFFDAQENAIEDSKPPDRAIDGATHEEGSRTPATTDGTVCYAQGDQQATETTAATASTVDARLHSYLEQAVAEGLLESFATESGAMYRFAHNRIKDCALHMADKSGLEQMHLEVGRQINQVLSDKSQCRNIDTVESLTLMATHHLNEGSSLITDASELYNLALLNEQAAEIAYNLVAFLPAAEYLKTATKFLGPSRWSTSYDMTLRIVSLLAHVHFCCGNPKQCEAMVNEVIENERTPFEASSVRAIRVENFSRQGKSHAAIEECRAVLDTLGVRIPRRNIMWHMLGGIIKTKKMLKKYSDDDLLKISYSNDSHTLLKIQFNRLLADTATVAEEMAVQLIGMLNAVRTSLTEGYAPDAPVIIAMCGLLYCFSNDLEKGQQYSKLMKDFIQESTPAADEAFALLIDTTYMNHLYATYQDCLDQANRTLHLAVEKGLPESFFIASACRTSLYLHSGLHLAPLVTDVLRLFEMMDEYQQPFARDMFVPHLQYILLLTGKPKNPTVLTGEYMDQDEYLAKYKEVKHRKVVAFYRMLLGFYFGDIDLCEKMIPLLLKPSTVPWMLPRLFFEALVYLRLARTKRRRKNLKKVGAIIKKFEDYLKKGNVNAHHMLLILQAERMSFERVGMSSVLESFNRAISVSARTGYTQNRALANELAGRYCISQNDPVWALNYLNRAYQSYVEWGAQAKADHLVKEFCDLGLSPSTQMKMGTFLKSKSETSGFSTERHESLNVSGFSVVVRRASVDSDESLGLSGTFLLDEDCLSVSS